jgi:hypothetical protein
MSLRRFIPTFTCEADAGRRGRAQAIDIIRLWFYVDDGYLTEVVRCGVGRNGPDGRHNLSYAFAAKVPRCRNGTPS